MPGTVLATVTGDAGGAGDAVRIVGGAGTSVGRSSGCAVPTGDEGPTVTSSTDEPGSGVLAMRDAAPADGRRDRLGALATICASSRGSAARSRAEPSREPAVCGRSVAERARCRRCCGQRGNPRRGEPRGSKRHRRPKRNRSRRCRFDLRTLECHGVARNAISVESAKMSTAIAMSAKNASA